MKKLKNKIKNNKILCTTLKIIKAIIIVLLIMTLMVILVQRFSDNDIAIGGLRIFNVASESMKGEYEVGDIIIIEQVEPYELKIGDNVTYMGNSGDMDGLVVTHKIISMRKDGDRYFYTTKGIANEIEDAEISFSQIYGKVVYKTIIFSFIGRIMTNIYAYYALFTIVGIATSIQIVSNVFDSKEEEAEDEQENTED